MHSSSCHSSLPPPCPVPSLWAPPVFLGDLGSRKPFPETTPRPRFGKGYLLLGMKGPRPLLLTSTRMTTLPFLMGMGVYQLMRHTSSALHLSAGRQGVLRLLGPSSSKFPRPQTTGIPLQLPTPPLSHGPHWGLCVVPSRPRNLLRPPRAPLQVRHLCEAPNKPPCPPGHRPL